MLSLIKSMPGNASLESMLREIRNLTAISALGLPAGLFADKRVSGKEDILVRITEASLAAPKEQVRQMVSPVASGELVHEYRTNLPLGALEMALWQRWRDRPPGVRQPGRGNLIHHSDRGRQYTPASTGAW